MTKVIEYHNPVTAQNQINHICKMAKSLGLSDRLGQAGILAAHLLKTGQGQPDAICKAFAAAADAEFKRKCVGKNGQHLSAFEQLYKELNGCELQE
ncbi:hypothetical protein ACFA67_004550 [Salmonella enterica]